MNDQRRERTTVTVGGHRMLVVDAGPADAPAVLMLHGLASDASTWDPVIDPLVARGLRVVAPDLLGHGWSDKPRSGYTLEGFSESLARLCRELEVNSPTLVGHSLGGAIAMHYAWVFPEHIGRLVLVCSGGLGRRVHPLLRAAALPGASRVLSMAVNPTLSRFYRRPSLHRVLRLQPDTVTNLGRTGRNIGERAGRTAFFHTLRHVISPQGQRGSMIELQLLDQHTPTLIVWSERDPVVPVSHAFDLHEHLPGSQLEILPGVSHEPHRRHPARFAEVLADFIEGSPLP